MNNNHIFGVSDFVAVFNQTIECAYPSVTIVGELSNFKVSKNRWVYFDLVDEQASVRFFGTVYSLSSSLEDGMILQVKGQPRLHAQFGFSVGFQIIQPIGEGSIKRATVLLEAKLRAEGLFDEERKRQLPHPPQKIGLITSGESAAYYDFIKIVNTRWGSIDISLADVQVQGEVASAQIVSAVEHFNEHMSVDCIVIIRGGGSPDDLVVFSAEDVTRVVATSRIPTLVAIGHEVDVSLAELAADRRASTPSNAAELLVPNKVDEARRLKIVHEQMVSQLMWLVDRQKQILQAAHENLARHTNDLLLRKKEKLRASQELLSAFNPEFVLRRGYAVVRSSNQQVVRSVKSIKKGDNLQIWLYDGSLDVIIKDSKVE